MKVNQFNSDNINRLVKIQKYLNENYDINVGKILPQKKLDTAYKNVEQRIANLRNKGIDIADGEWITYLDSDDIILPNRLSNLNKLVLKHQDAEAVFIDGNELFPITDNVLNAPLINPVETSKLNKGSIVINDKEYKYIEMDLIRNLTINAKKHGGISKGIMFSTSRISHKRDISVRWPNMSERGEDTTFAKMIMKDCKYYLVDNPTYLVCHSLSLFDI